MVSQYSCSQSCDCELASTWNAVQFIILYFINGHVTQKLACVMAAISMAPNVTLKSHRGVVTDVKCYNTWTLPTAIRILCPLVYSHIATKHMRQVFCDLFPSLLRHTAFLMRSTWLSKHGVVSSSYLDDCCCGIWSKICQIFFSDQISNRSSTYEAKSKMRDADVHFRVSRLGIRLC